MTPNCPEAFLPTLCQKHQQRSFSNVRNLHWQTEFKSMLRQPWQFPWFESPFFSYLGKNKSAGTNSRWIIFYWIKILNTYTYIIKICHSNKHALKLPTFAQRDYLYH
jgi:hypothetical protein